MLTVVFFQICTGIIKEDVSLTPPSLTPPLVSPISDSSSPLSLSKSRTGSKQVDANSFFTFYPSKKAITHGNRYFPRYQKYNHYYPSKLCFNINPTWHNFAISLLNFYIFCHSTCKAKIFKKSSKMVFYLEKLQKKVSI